MTPLQRAGSDEVLDLFKALYNLDLIILGEFHCITTAQMKHLVGLNRKFNMLWRTSYF